MIVSPFVRFRDTLTGRMGPSQPPDKPMNRESLDKLRRSLALLSGDRVRSIYREAWARCKMDGERLPSPQAVQELVQAWRQLWRWRNNRPG